VRRISLRVENVLGFQGGWGWSTGISRPEVGGGKSEGQFEMKRIGACLLACLKSERWPSKASGESNKKKRKRNGGNSCFDEMMRDGQSRQTRTDISRNSEQRSNEIHPFCVVPCNTQSTALCLVTSWCYYSFQRPPSV
jgi:hypothetical protein